MQYTLMHKNHKVMELTISQDCTQILHVGEIFDERRIPVGLRIPLRRSVNHWWHRRAIPASRSGLSQALRSLHLNAPEELLTKCFGLSLSDQYWVKPVDADMTWEQVNFFDHDFSEDVGNILLGEPALAGTSQCRKAAKVGDTCEGISYLSPDSSVGGWLRKKWKIVDGKRCLLKGGSNFWSEPFNEVIASMIADRLGISHVAYWLSFEGKHHAPMSVCEDFITRDTELVEASSIARVLEMQDGESKYDHFCRCCESLHIPEYANSLDEMLVLDFLIANQDRHKGNFGAIRDAETLEFLGMAPLFDCGTSLRYDTPDVYIEPDLNVESQPFCSFHNEQIGLVQHPERFDLTVLRGIDEEIRTMFSDERARAYIPESRAEQITQVVTTRIAMLEQQFVQMQMGAEEAPELKL